MSKNLSCPAIASGLVVLFLSGGELLAQNLTPALARGGVAGCNVPALQAAENEFLRLVELRRRVSSTVTDERLREASANYVINANACYETLYGPSAEYIDDGGLVFGPQGAESYDLAGRKWGTGSPFTPGPTGEGPRLPGGTVTYSFMEVWTAASLLRSGEPVTARPTMCR
jgi:hypothetical protein